MRRFVFPLILGAFGVSVLIGLGLWQLRRLDWKEAMLAEVAAQIGADPVDLAGIAAPDPGTDRFRPVTVSGRTTGHEILVVSGMAGAGPGYEVISSFEIAGGRRIMLDRGFLPEAARQAALAPVDLSVTGNLHWPREADRFTPEPDRALGVWFARDVDSMADYLGTDRLLVVIRTAEGDTQGIVPRPVDTSEIPNNHREYAITWFSLAGIWGAMTAYLLWRNRRDAG